MGRIRSVKPDVCQHDVMALLSDGAERTLVRLWTHADDEGRGVDNVKLIKAAIYPLNDEKTEEVIDVLLDELEAAGFLRRYEVNGRSYFEVPNFPDHQKPRHPVASKHPPAPADHTPTAIRRSVTASTPQTVGGSPDHVPPQTYGGPPAGGEGLGVGVGEGGATPEPVPHTHVLLAPDRPPSLSIELDQIVMVLADAHGPDRVEAAVATLVDSRRRFPWPKDARKALEAILGPPAVEAKPHPLDTTAAAARALEAEGNAYMDGLRAIPVDPEAADRMKSLRESLHGAKESA